MQDAPRSLPSAEELISEALRSFKSQPNINELHSRTYELMIAYKSQYYERKGVRVCKHDGRGLSQNLSIFSTHLWEPCRALCAERTRTNRIKEELSFQKTCG